MTFLQDLPDIAVIIILAIVQGIAEFLPISSSGHLVILSELLGKEPSGQVNIVLHAGTLLSILVFYRERIIRLLTSDRRVIGLLVVGSLPVAIIGVAIKLYCPEVTESTFLSGFMLIVTGLLLMATKWMKPGNAEYTELSPPRALWVGLCQALALLPGVSRSGATIFAGQQVGLKNESAATFSFLLAIPAILGATIFEVKSIMEESSTAHPIGELIAGAAISFVVGLAALRVLVKVLNKDRLHLFAYWVLPLGFIIIIWQLYELLSTRMAV